MRLVVKRHKYPSGTPCWQVSGTLPHGERVRRFFPTQQEADALAAELEYQHAHPGSLSEADACRAKLAPHGLTLRDVTDYALKNLVPHAQDPSMREIVGRFLEAYDGVKRAKSTYANMHSRMRKFAEHFGERHLHELRLPDYDGWVAALQREGYEPTGVHHFVACARQFVNWAVLREYCASNLLKGVQLDRPEQRCPAVFSVAQAELLLRIAPKHELLAWAVYGCLCGVRQGEMELLDLSSYDARERTITIDGEQFSASERRVIELEGAWGDAVMAWLARCPCRGPVIPVPWRPRMEALRAELGYWPRNVMRHTAASAHFAYFSDVAKTMKMLGHTGNGDVSGRADN